MGRGNIKVNHNTALSHLTLCLRRPGLGLVQAMLGSMQVG